MKNKALNKTLKIAVPIIFWLAVWEAASLLVKEDLMLFLPEPLAVGKAFIALVPTKEFWQATGTTLLRILSGLLLGSAAGIILGVLTAEIKILDFIFSPALKVIRAVPVVSFIILAFLFINVDSLPVFISFLMVTPLVWQSVHDGINSADVKLLEMAKVYKIGRFKSLFSIKLFGCMNQIVSSLISAVGLAWKSGIAAEVICTPIISMGTSIVRSKNSLEYDSVFALTLAVVILSLIFEVLLKYLWKKYGLREADFNA